LLQQNIAINERLLFHAACGPTAIGVLDYYSITFQRDDSVVSHTVSVCLADNKGRR
jgi:hypothetical protein